MFHSAFHLLRLAVAWSLALLLLGALLAELFGGGGVEAVLLAIGLLVFLRVLVRAFSQLRRVRLIVERPTAAALSNRQRRRIEMPFDAGEAFDLLEAAVRELPGVEEVQVARDSLQLRAKLQRIDPYGRHRGTPPPRRRRLRNQIHATVAPGDGVGSITLVCEPEIGAWSDAFLVDDGTNLENAEAVTRALTRRIAERRRGERDHARQSATEKELAVARLNLLHAQVEPHFLYNTLASAQHLTRTQPTLADEMLGHLITYLRRSLPRTDDAPSTLGDELERVRAYLEIMKLRMGARLATQFDVPKPLLAARFPTMMLQTLAENAIKHGLEPRTSGGSVWIHAGERDGRLAVTVADDGLGFGEPSSGTGIGLRNLRERLQLAYGDAARFDVVANFPSGVAATITLPLERDT